MEILIHQINKINIAEIVSENIEIHDIQDALDIMANSGYKGSNKIIVQEKNIIKDFFDLKTGIAGEILQKFSNYKFQLAIVGDFTKYSSKSLKDFIYESNKNRQIIFVNSIDDAKEKLISEI